MSVQLHSEQGCGVGVGSRESGYFAGCGVGVGPQKLSGVGVGVGFCKNSPTPDSGIKNSLMRINNFFLRFRKKSTKILL